MRRFVAPLLAMVSAFPQAVPPVTTVTPTGIAPAQASTQIKVLPATKTRETYAIGPTGGITLKLEERGTFSRNSAGDEATHLNVIRDGQAAPGSSVINQRKDRISYVIDDVRQQYRVVTWMEIPARGNEVERQPGPVVTRTINDIKCVAVGVRDSTGKAGGKDWVSPDYGITVRSERDVLNQETGAVIGLVVEELSDIQFGVTPDQSAFAHSSRIQGSEEVSGTEEQPERNRLLTGPSHSQKKLSSESARTRWSRAGSATLLRTAAVPGH